MHPLKCFHDDNHCQRIFERNYSLCENKAFAKEEQPFLEADYVGTMDPIEEA